MNHAKLFGTDGIRGEIGKAPFTPATLTSIGAALGRLLRTQQRAFRRHKNRNAKMRAGRPLAFIGGDTRESRSMVLTALASGLLMEGVDVIDAGVLPTPAVSVLASKHNANVGIVISASHNPYHDNGIKVFGGDGYKITDALERAIEREVYHASQAPSISSLGQLHPAPAAQEYIETVVRQFSKRLHLKGLRIALDCANGATHYVAPAIFRLLGARVFAFNDAPDGTNINSHCGALHPELLVRPVLRHKAHIGFSFDGDGDRVIAIDDKGFVRDGDYLMAILARHLKMRGTLHKQTVVTTVMSNLGLELAAKTGKIKLLRTPVGDKYVAETMLAKGFSLGGEQSGHLILAKESTTGDGIVSALCVLEAMQHSKQPLSLLAQAMTKYPQVLINVKVREKKPFEKIPGFRDTISSVEKALGRDGRVLLRYSGTENLARIMLEGKELREIKSLAQRMADVLAEHIGA